LVQISEIFNGVGINSYTAFMVDKAKFDNSKSISKLEFT
jgi:hypothetical protein